MALTMLPVYAVLKNAYAIKDISRVRDGFEARAFS